MLENLVSTTLAFVIVHGIYAMFRYLRSLLRQSGFTNVEVTQASGTYAIDILAEKEGVTYAIQYKCYSNNVGNHAVQETHSGAAYYGRIVPVVMTNRHFTRVAK